MTQKKTGKTEHPHWINEYQNCCWCHKSASIDDIHLSNDKENVRVFYKCKNDECTFPLKGERGPYTFGFEHAGYAENYKKFLLGPVEKIEPETIKV